ncbi:MAG: class I SAM-dependent methyltransferase [Chloroflexi bacterium]|nr:class I SAM-dependent methyltransferase [Chloroflexota bacterium]
MSDSVLAFYEQLARDYHLIFADWARAIERQGSALDRLIQAHMNRMPLTVLDCACGIGTQAIGLADRGYTVHASDISPAAVERAAQEADNYGVPLTTGVADMRTLAAQVEGTFDVVLACDNAVPHLLSDDELLQAAQHKHAKLRPDGLLLVSIRDYDHLTLNKPRATQPQVFDDEAEGRRIVFQVWDWAADGSGYTVNMFIMRQHGSRWDTAHHATRYRALLRAEYGNILAQAGFDDIRWHMPQDTGYYQPVVTARP